MTIQAMNTGILLSGYRPELNLVVKAVVVISVLLLQSPRLTGLSFWFSGKGTT
jgi:ribose/xylose/arabinose/galactoside ABC-type transport system permease subunit